MERNFAAVTIFTLLFAVTTARISLDLKQTDSPVVHRECDVNSLPESATEDTNLVVLPTEITRSRSDAADLVRKLDNDRMIRVDLTPRSDYARFHAINRRFSGQHRIPVRPYKQLRNPFVIPRSEISGKFEARNAHRHGDSTRLKYKHDYGHQHRHQHHHSHRNSNYVSVPKHKLAKTQSLMQQHREKTKQREASSFMKSIRKFLKHTFD